ncbi:MAG TPA: imidazole glycerol phosphate synthase subunit HisH [Rubricoccaceae bacterium]
MTVLLDYGIGNLRSLERAFERAGVAVLRSGRIEDARAAQRLVLPGVGAFGACAAALHETGLDAVVVERVAAGVPLLGVCVGMQLLFEHSDEGDASGLGLLAGRVVRFAHGATGPDGARLKVPHMGWNALRTVRPHPVVTGLGEAPHVYFVHSYHALPADPADVVADADYGVAVPAVIARGGVVGVQFHPEKSGPVGTAILRAWDAAFAPAAPETGATQSNVSLSAAGLSAL